MKSKLKNPPSLAGVSKTAKGGSVQDSSNLPSGGAGKGAKMQPTGIKNGASFGGPSGDRGRGGSVTSFTSSPTTKVTAFKPEMHAKIPASKKIKGHGT